MMAGETRTDITDERSLFRDDTNAPLIIFEPVPGLPSSAVPVRVDARPSGRLSLQRTWEWAQSLAQAEAARGTGFHFAPVFLGAGAALYFTMAAEPALAPFIFLLVLLSLCAVAARQRAVIRAVMIACALTSTGIVAAKVQTIRQNTILLGEQITTRVTGRVLSIEKVAKGYRAIVEVLATERPTLKFQPERIKVTLRKAPFGLQAGQGIKGLFLLRPPTGPVRPGSFDFSFDAYFDRVGASGISLTEVEPAVIPSPGVLRAAGFWFERQRTLIAERVRKRITGQNGEMAAALITGLTGGISEATNDAMRVTGLAHVTSISGLHMALVAGAVMGIVRFLLALFPVSASGYSTKKVAAILAFFASFIYYLLSGGGVATLRSFIMLAVMLVAVMFDQRALTMRNLVIAAIIILVVTPHEIMGPSFQMSFAATAALIGAFQAWTNRPQFHSSREHGAWRRALRSVLFFLLGLAATSLIAGSATAIYSAYHFNRIAPLGLFANLAAMPAVSLIVMPMALLAVLLMPFGLDGFPLDLMGQGVAIMLSTADYFAALSPVGASGLMPGKAVVTFTLGLALLCLLTTRLKLTAVPLFAAGIALTAARAAPDVMISEDARLVAVRDAAGSLAVSRERPNRFTIENWQRAYMTETLVLPVEEAAKGAQFECSDGYCSAALADGRRVGRVEDPAILGAACIDADVLVVAFPVTRRGCGPSGAFVVSARDLARRGAAEIVFEDGAPVLAQAFPSTDRPWHRHRIFSRAARSMPPYVAKPKTAPPRTEATLTP